MHEARLRPVIEAKVREVGVPGAIVGAVRGTEPPWRVTLGVRDLATQAPMAVDDHVRIGSITKTVTGTVVLQLADEGKLSLDDPIARYVDGVPDGEHLTLRQLGTMTSGLYPYTDDAPLLRRMDADPLQRFTPRELLEIAFRHPPGFAPGKGWQYSNTNTVLLGLVIEKVADPRPSGDGPPPDVTNQDPSWAFTAGALISTVDALLRYAEPLATGQGLVSTAAQRERLAWAPQIDPPTPVRYGFAIAAFGGAIGHNGQINGFQSFLASLPDKDLSLVILVNLFATRDGKEPADEIAKALLAALRAP